MKEKILNFLKTSKLKKKLIYSIRKASWFPELEAEFLSLKLPLGWGLQRKLWHYWKCTNEVPLCPVSGKERKWRAGNSTERIDIPGMSEGYSIFADNNAANKGNVSIRKKSLASKYGKGVTNPMLIPNIREKRKDHFLKKYGVENPSSNEQVKQKRLNTMLKRYGIEHNFIDWQNKHFKKHGVYNPAHLSNVAEKTAFNRFKKRKEYKLLTDEIIYLQGYEPFGFDYLKLTYQEEQIKFKKRDMPEIWYTWNQKTRRYYCDFFIPDDNLVIEIKSMFTLSRDFDMVKQKILSAQTKGYKVLLLVFDQFGGLVLEKDATRFLEDE